MAFNGTEGGAIDLTIASQMTAAYRSANPTAVKAHFFGKDIINSILSQNGCMGLRIYYGIDNRGNKQLVIAGAGANENDILTIVADLSTPCPQWCGETNALNS